MIFYLSLKACLISGISLYYTRLFSSLHTRRHSSPDNHPHLELSKMKCGYSKKLAEARLPWLRFFERSEIAILIPRQRFLSFHSCFPYTTFGHLSISSEPVSKSRSSYRTSPLSFFPTIATFQQLVKLLVLLPPSRVRNLGIRLRVCLAHFES